MRTGDDIQRITSRATHPCLFSGQGGHMMENSPAALRTFCQLGARYITVTHCDIIDWADAATDHPGHYRLTEFVSA